VNAVEALLDSLPRTTLVVGKGGVGKTTCATGLAAAFAAHGQHTLLMSTDPAAALATVIGAPVDIAPSPVPGCAYLEARQLSAADLRRDFLAAWRETIAEIVDRGTYLDRVDVDGLVDAALPGADEIFALLALGDALADGSGGYQRLIIDTAPTGHTLRLLALPDTMRALVAMLEAMQEKHRFMVRALARRYRRDRADDFLDEMRSRLDALRAALSNPSAVAALLVTRIEPVVAAETVRYAGALGALSLRVAGVLMNAAPARLDAHARQAMAMLAPLEALAPQYSLPITVPPPQGISAVAELFHRLATALHAPPAPHARHARHARHAWHARHPVASEFDPSSLARELTIVGGKGGVGKTTVACALAIAAADAAPSGRPVLLVSTDPAPSIADALGESDAAWSRADEEHAVPEVPLLVVRQMDAGAAFTRMREEYQRNIDALFDALVARGVNVAHDRAILRDLLALAPPGIDELYALAILGDALAAGRFERIVVDPAPTGHLLRLLEMPALALDWSHRLMRLMLKYREVVGLGDAAEALLEFARRTRGLDQLLHDASRAGVLVVTLGEPVVRAETERLLASLGARGIAVIGLVRNRVERAGGTLEERPQPTNSPLPAEPPVAQLLAEEVTPPPIGAAALRAWSSTWRRLASRDVI